VELFHDENDKPRGCGIVEFESADSVKKAVEKMHRYDLKGRKLVVKEVSRSAREHIWLVSLGCTLQFWT
jgi:RNA recognition motif-containing protein